MKRSNVTKLLAALMSTTMCLSLAACGQTESNAPEKEESKKQESSVVEKSESEVQQEEIPTITVAMMATDRNVENEDNYAVNWLEENAGVNIEWLLLPNNTSEAETKLNLLFTNGDYPDVVMFPMTKEKMVQLGKEGIFIPLNEYYEENSVHLKQVFESNQSYYANSIAADGNMYGIINPQECLHCSGDVKFWYNSEWLESLGMEVPTTTEELKAVMLAAKKSDYNGNGKEDEITMTGRGDGHMQYMFMNFFIPCNDETMSYAKDGKVIFAPDKEEFKMGLEYMKDLYDNGLIDPAGFTNDPEQTRATFQADDHRVFAFAGGHYLTCANAANTYTNRVLTALAPVSSPVCEGYLMEMSYVDQSSKFGYFVTDNCENPEAAFKLGDAMMSEEYFAVNMYGEKGVKWDELEAGVPTPGMEEFIVYYDLNAHEEPEDYVVNNAINYQQYNGTQTVRAAYGEYLLLNEADHYEKAGFGYRLFEEQARLNSLDCFYPEYLPRYITIEDEDVRSRFAELQVTLKEYVRSAMDQFITGELDLEKDWDAYLSNLQGYGMEEYISIYQDAYTQYLNN